MGNSRLGYINFANAFFVEEMQGEPERIAEHLQRAHCFFSPYDMEGFRFSFRDDVFKAVAAHPGRALPGAV